MTFRARLLSRSLLFCFLISSGCGTESSRGLLERPQSNGGTADAGTNNGTADSGMSQNMGSGLCEGDSAAIVRPDNWAKESHCSGEDGDYAKLFDAVTVHRIDIVVNPSNYQAQLDDLTSILGNSGGMTGPPGGGGLDNTQTPIWVPVTIQFDGKEWNQVGMRYKGNSSLHSAWRQNIKKFAFRLSFDKYEENYPELDDQRFFGFKKMTFSNGFSDNSLIRDKLAGDIFRSGGVPAARGAFARIFVDFGQGPTYYGIYTMIEDVSNRMLDTQFTDDSGNLYKPENEGATWDRLITQDFDKKTNEEEMDWSDIMTAHSALHADRSNATAWRTEFEKVFNVELFLRYLAINQAMTNWDSYGLMNHNYYVYADPADNGRFAWIPWDLNEAMLVKGRNSSVAESVFLDEIGNEWPLIRFLLDDPTYFAQYKLELQAAIDGPLESNALFQKMDEYHNLLAPYVSGAEGEQAPYTFLRDMRDFDDSLSSNRDGLKTHITERISRVRQALQ